MVFIDLEISTQMSKLQMTIVHAKVLILKEDKWNANPFEGLAFHYYINSLIII